MKPPLPPLFGPLPPSPLEPPPAGVPAVPLPPPPITDPPPESLEHAETREPMRAQPSREEARCIWSTSFVSPERRAARITGDRGRPSGHDLVSLRITLAGSRE